MFDKICKKLELANILKSLWDTWMRHNVETVMKPVGNAMIIGNL